MIRSDSSFDYLFLAAVLASRSVCYGHICLDLNTLAGNVIPSFEEGDETIACPEHRISRQSGLSDALRNQKQINI
ncbi:MAG: hypothetical protein AB2L12_17195 [Smithellaceae bacterium]